MDTDPLDALDALPQDEKPPKSAPVPTPAKRPPDATEVRGSQDLPGTVKGEGTAQLFAMAFAFHPFSALFERLAVARYPRLADKRACVDRHALNSPALYKFCVVADAVAVSAVVLILLGTLALGAAKTLFGSF